MGKHETPSRATAAQAEALRLGAIKTIGRAPAACGPAIVAVAPARGLCAAFTPVSVVPVGADGYEVVERGYKGRKALKVADVFDAINSAIAKAGTNPPFTRRQIEAARSYAALVEQHAAFGLKGSAIFRDAPGGTGGMDPTERALAMRRKLDQCHRAIGPGVAKEIRRQRPSSRTADGTPKRNITDRDLVDMVCTEGKSLRGALQARGWSAKGDNIRAVYRALFAALDRLAGCF